MKFCEVCDNLLYVKLGDNGIMHQCNYCDNVEEYDQDNAEPVFDTDYKSERAKYHHLLTPLVHQDPTLPRVDNVSCPNKKCTRAPKSKSEVLFIKYDPVNMKFLYSCAHCKHFWGPEELGTSYDPLK